MARAARSRRDSAVSPPATRHPLGCRCRPWPGWPLAASVRLVEDPSNPMRGRPMLGLTTNDEQLTQVFAFSNRVSVVVPTTVFHLSSSQPPRPRDLPGTPHLPTKLVLNERRVAMRFSPGRPNAVQRAQQNWTPVRRGRHLETSGQTLRTLLPMSHYPKAAFGAAASPCLRCRLQVRDLWSKRRRL